MYLQSFVNLVFLIIKSLLYPKPKACCMETDLAVLYKRFRSSHNTVAHVKKSTIYGFGTNLHVNYVGGLLMANILNLEIPKLASCASPDRSVH